VCASGPKTRGCRLPLGEVTVMCNGPVPVIRQTIFNSSPLCGGMCPGPRARPHSWPRLLVPWTSFGLALVPNNEGVEHLLVGGAVAPEGGKELPTMPKSHPRTTAAKPARLLIATECHVQSACSSCDWSVQLRARPHGPSKVSPRYAGSRRCDAVPRDTREEPVSVLQRPASLSHGVVQQHVPG
jgi:hypothetical protein